MFAGLFTIKSAEPCRFVLLVAADQTELLNCCSAIEVSNLVRNIVQMLEPCLSNAFFLAFMPGNLLGLSRCMHPHVNQPNVNSPMLSLSNDSDLVNYLGKGMLSCDVRRSCCREVRESQIDPSASVRYSYYLRRSVMLCESDSGMLITRFENRYGLVRRAAKYRAMANSTSELPFRCRDSDNHRPLTGGLIRPGSALDGEATNRPCLSTSDSLDISFNS